MIYTDGICSELGCHGGIKDITVGRVGLDLFFSFPFLNLENLSGSAHKLQVWHLLCLRLSGNKKRKWRIDPKSRFPAFMPKWF